MLMMNCYMMNMHTMYSMSKNVQCLVAPQGAISNPGYNYKSILEYISKESGQVTPALLARHCVESACDRSAEKRAIRMGLSPDETIGTWSLFAIDLHARKDNDSETWFDKQVNTLATLMEAVIDKYNHPVNRNGGNDNSS